MIGIGIVGCNYGRMVLIPAFRRDPRCEVVALAATDAERAGEFARDGDVPRAFGGWQALVEEPTVAVVAIAVPPDVQPAIAQRALELGKPVFLEKPLAADLAGAQMIFKSAHKSGLATAIDFNFPELLPWQRAKEILHAGAIGRLQNVIISWNFENQATRQRLANWKTYGDRGGGLLGNFVSHCFYNLEWLCGPISGLNARLFPMPDRKTDGNITLMLAFASGAGGSLQVSSASFLGSGYRIELYGADGTLFLSNPTRDYFRGFELKVGRRGEETLKPVAIENVDEGQFTDSRTVPVSRLVRRFIDAYERGGSASPGVSEGYRVQYLIEAARRAHLTGRWIDVMPRIDDPYDCQPQ
jgi:predicted dehydrogenase